MTKNIGLLFFSQLFGMTGSIIITFLGALIGIRLSPEPSLVSLPISILVIGAACFSIPSALFMKKFGRKHCFLLAALLATVGAMLAAISLKISSFSLFCLGAFLIGINSAFIQQYRFAVVEELESKLATKAISILLFGNLLSVYLGILAAVHTKNLFLAEYTGSFIILAVFLLISFILLLFYKNINAVSIVQKASRAPEQVITQNLVPAIILATCSYVVMSLLMVATPVNMHTLHHMSVDNISTVMQFHLLAMYCPSLLISRLTRIINSTGVIFIGIILLLCAIFINLLGNHFDNYLFGLILVGIGWNFSFISATTIFTESYLFQHRFKFQAINDLCIFGFNAIASLLSGWLVLLVGWRVINIGSLLLLSLMLFSIVLIYRNNYKKHANTYAYSQSY